jgi:hypothetical protein
MRRFKHLGKRRFDVGLGARWRRSGGDPGVGCTHMPVGTYLYLHAVGAVNHVAVPCLARLGARRGDIRRLRSAGQQLSGRFSAEGFYEYYVYTSVKIARSASPIFFSRLDTSQILSCPWVGRVSDAHFGGEEGIGGSELAAGVETID